MSNRISEIYKKYLILSGTQKQELILAIFWLPFMHFRLKRFGINSCLELLEREKRYHRQQPVSLDRDYKLGLACERSVALASRYGLIAGTCLSRSLTVMRLMARRGIAGRLRIGVNIETGTLTAHAWVEVAGEPLCDHNERFVPFSPLMNL
jgi:hypothetical protein